MTLSKEEREKVIELRLKKVDGRTRSFNEINKELGFKVSTQAIYDTWRRYQLKQLNG